MEREDPYGRDERWPPDAPVGPYGSWYAETPGSVSADGDRYPHRSSDFVLVVNAACASPFLGLGMFVLTWWAEAVLTLIWAPGIVLSGALVRALKPGVDRRGSMVVSRWLRPASWACFGAAMLLSVCGFAYLAMLTAADLHPSQ